MFSCMLVVFAFLTFFSKFVLAQYTLTPLAGTGVWGNTGDNGPATSAQVGFMSGVWTDSDGNTFVADSGHHLVRKIDTAGIITTIGGTGKLGDAKTQGGKPFKSVPLAMLGRVGMYGDSNFLYVSDKYHVWKYDRGTGNVTVLAGGGPSAVVADGSPATSGKLNSMSGLWISTDNYLYVVERSDHYVRRINLVTNVMDRVAGNRASSGFGGDGGSALSTNVKFNTPQAIYIDSNGLIYIVDSANRRIRYIENGIINTFAGGGPWQNEGAGFLATETYFVSVADVKGDTAGNIYVRDSENIFVVDSSTKVVKKYITGVSRAECVWFDAHLNRVIITSLAGSVFTALPYVPETSSPSSRPTSSSSIPSGQPSSIPSGQPTMSPTAPTFTPTKSPSFSPTVKNDDVVKVSGTSRVKFVSGDTLTVLSLTTLALAFQNISGNAQSTVITSTVLVGQSSSQSNGSSKRTVRRALVASVSGQATPTQPSYIYDIGFLSSYEMTYHAAYTSLQLAALKARRIRQAIEVGQFNRALSDLAQARNATQLLNGTSNEVMSVDSVVVSASSSTSSNSNDDDRFPTGTVAGIVIGVLVGCLVLMVVVYVLLKKKREIYEIDKDEKKNRV